MPKLYRVMKKDADDKPIVGTGSSELGVRPGEMLDNPPGEAHPGKGGMSVQPSLQALAERFLNWVPKRLAETNPGLFRGATGRPSTTSIWTMGEGPFVDGPVATDLALRCDTDEQPVLHGVVEPDRVMPLVEFQSALAATRDQWAVEES